MIGFNCFQGYQQSVALADVRSRAFVLLLFSGVARMPKSYTHQRETTWFSSVESLIKMGTLSSRKEFAPRGSEFFPLRAVLHTMENHFYLIR